MNDTMSLLLATTILAFGGLGLYMYKSSNDDQNEEYNEQGLFGLDMDLFNWGEKTEDKEEDEYAEELDENDAEEEYKPRKRASKTQRNRKTSGNSRRRYY
jgi:hypothetical protein